MKGFRKQRLLQKNPLRISAIYSSSVFFDSVAPAPNVDSFAPALLAPEGLPLAVSRAVTLTAWVPFGPPSVALPCAAPARGCVLRG